MSNLKSNYIDIIILWNIPEEKEKYSRTYFCAYVISDYKSDTIGLLQVILIGCQDSKTMSLK